MKKGSFFTALIYSIFNIPTAMTIGAAIDHLFRRGKARSKFDLAALDKAEARRQRRAERNLRGSI
jgi:uncharacterized protein (DUF2126 family)